MLIVAFASVGWVTIVTNIQGRSVAETAPTNGQALVYDTSTGTWKPGDVAASLTAHQSTHQPGGSDSLSDTYVVTTRAITAGTGLSGGGDLSADRTLAVDSSVLTPSYSNLQGTPSTFAPSAHQSTHQPGQSDSLSDTYALTTTQIVAGTGLSGGGAISGNVVLNVDSSVLTPSYSNLQGTPSTFAPSAHAASHTNGTDNLTVSGFLTIDATAGISPRYSTSDFDVSAGNLVLHNVVSAGTVGDASNYPVITYDAKGRITGVSTISVTSTSSSTVAYVEQHELIPLYIYPGSDWDTVASQAPGTGMVIVNPNSGPGSSLDTTYRSYIKALQRKGVYCVGYVDTTYGARAIDDVKAEIALYYEWYQPDGIFLDEIPTTTGASELTYYANLYAYTKTHSGRALVVLNPGTNTAEEYMARSDVICTWENPYSTYAAYVPDAWTTKYPANRFYHIAIGASDAEATTFKALAKTRNVGWVYATDDVMPNPFDALPTYGVTQTGYLRTCAVATAMPLTSVAAAAAVEQHELIPLYIYPGASWDTVKSEYPGVGMIIANPASGPGTSVKANYKSYIFKMQQHGLKVIGYVPTNYEATDIATVKANIDKWYSFYWPDGIFLDQISASPDATQLAYLQELYTYIKAKSEIAVVVLDPGTNCLESLMTCADILATYENDYSDYAAYTPDTWAAKYHPTRFWHLIFNATEAEAVTARALARSRNVGWTFVTDDTMVDWDPFDTLATYGVTQTAYMKDELARRTPDDPMSSVCGGRVTKQNGKFVFAPYTSNRCCLFVDGVWRPYVIPDAGLSIDCSPSALGADVDGWIYADGSSGTLAIKESKTGVTLQNGIAVQSGDVDCLALVRFRTNNYGAVIAVDDAPSKAMFCNYFNRRPNVVSKAGSTEHVYGTGSWAYWNADSAEKVEWVGVDAAPVTCMIDGALTPTAGSPRLGVGLNAATAHAYAYQGTTSPLVVGAHYSGAQSAGANYAAALEYATDNTTYSSYRLTVQVMQ